MTVEFIVRIELTVPSGVNPDELARLRAQEASRAQALAAAGNIVRLWRSDSAWGNWGLWRSDSRAALVGLLESLPLFPYMAIEIHDLTEHPSDPLRRNSSMESSAHG